MNPGHLGFLVKADEHFYEGLAALLASIRHWHPHDPVRILDCGLTTRQRAALELAGFTDIFAPDLTGFSVVSGSEDYYTPAVFAVLAQPSALFPLTIHVDADAVLLQTLQPSIDDVMHDSVGLAAVTDYPPLGLDFQIGEDPIAHAEVLRAIPNLDLASIGFNGGFYILSKQYFIDRLQTMVLRLLPLHNRLWGNEMAILNLAAYAASPDRPFFKLAHTFNHRPSYRRAPELAQISNVDDGEGAYPQLLGHFGRVALLHFVGRIKPWKSAEQTPAFRAWRFYRHMAATTFGL